MLMNIGVFAEMKSHRAIMIRETRSNACSSLCFGSFLERGVGLVDLVISGLLGFGELESLEVVKRSSAKIRLDA